jgi:hypothetical protein
MWGCKKDCQNEKKKVKTKKNSQRPSLQRVLPSCDGCRVGAAWVPRTHQLRGVGLEREVHVVAGDLQLHSSLVGRHLSHPEKNELWLLGIYPFLHPQVPTHPQLLADDEGRYIPAPPSLPRRVVCLGLAWRRCTCQTV